MSDIPAGVFSRVTGATGDFNQAVYMKPGHYLVLVNGVKYKRTRSNKNGLIVETSVLDVISCPEQWQNGKVGAVEPMPKPSVGDRMTDFIDIDKDYGPDAVCRFIGTCFGVDPKSVDDQAAAKACGPGQPCAGLVLEINNTEHANKPRTICYVRVGYMRQIPPSELANMDLSEAALKLLGGQAGLDAAVAREIELAKSATK